MSLLQFVEMGIVLLNPDDSRRLTNSPKNVYLVETSALELVRTFDTDEEAQEPLRVSGFDGGEEPVARGSPSDNGHKRRPPPDPVNAVLSFAYSMLTHECTAAARLASLEPTLGAVHATRPGRPALSLDLMEPFRPLLADSIAVSTDARERPR